MYPYIDDTIPFYIVSLYGILGPLVIFILVEMFNAKLFPYQKKQQRLKFYIKSFSSFTFHALDSFLFGVAFTLLLTSIGKRMTGSLRPSNLL